MTKRTVVLAPAACRSAMPRRTPAAGGDRYSVARHSRHSERSHRRCPRGEASRGRRSALLLVASVLTILISSCYPGVYSVDVFPEMHYQPSYRPYEPPRLSAPESAVPVTGRSVPPADFAAASELRSPIQAGPDTNRAADELFAVNCRPCHGPEGRGDGFITQYFERVQAAPPVDFASPRARFRTDGQLFFILTDGIGNMPAFGKLLTPTERWLLVHFIRSVQARTPQS